MIKMQIALLVCFFAMVKSSTSSSLFDCQDQCFEDPNTIDGISQCLMPSEMKDLSREEGDFKLGCCYFTRNTSIAYYWYIDGKQIIDTNVNLEITNDSFGSYLSFPDKDAGEIFEKTNLNVTCKARTSQGERSHSIRLTTNFICGSDYAESKIVVHPEPAQVLEGDAAQFNCTIFSIRDFLTKWHVNGLEVDESNPRYEIITQRNTSICENVTTTLRFKKILRDDFGDEFTCVLYFPSDDISEIQSKAAKLTMKEIDVITIENYGLGIAVGLSLLAMIMAIAAYKFRVELLVLIRGKIPYTKM